MGMGNIANVDEVPYTGAVAGIIIITKNLHEGQFADGGLGDGGYEVGGFADGQFAYEDGGVGAYGVEVAEEHALGCIGFGEFVDDLFPHLFGITVG